MLVDSSRSSFVQLFCSSGKVRACYTGKHLTIDPNSLPTLYIYILKEGRAWKHFLFISFSLFFFLTFNTEQMENTVNLKINFHFFRFYSIYKSINHKSVAFNVEVYYSVWSKTSCIKQRNRTLSKNILLFIYCTQ